MTDIITNYIVNLTEEAVVHNNSETTVIIDWRGIKKIDIIKPIVNAFFLQYSKEYDVYSNGNEEKFKTSFLQECLKDIEKAININSELKYLSFFSKGLQFGYNNKRKRFKHSIDYALLLSTVPVILKNKCGKDIIINKESELYNHLFPKSFNLQSLKDELIIKDLIL